MNQIVHGVMRELEIPSDFPAVCIALALMALATLGGYFALSWIDPGRERVGIGHFFMAGGRLLTDGGRR